MQRHVRRGERYRHFKGGLYRIEHVALCSETQRSIVVYRALSDGRVWTRPLDEFLGRALSHYSHTDIGERFTKVEENVFVRSVIEHTKRLVRCLIQFFAS